MNADRRVLVLTTTFTFRTSIIMACEAEDKTCSTTLLVQDTGVHGLSLEPASCC